MEIDNVKEGKKPPKLMELLTGSDGRIMLSIYREYNFYTVEENNDGVIATFKNPWHLLDFLNMAKNW